MRAQTTRTGVAAVTAMIASVVAAVAVPDMVAAAKRTAMTTKKAKVAGTASGAGSAAGAKVIWVSPAGNDGRTGATRAEAIRTVTEAWRRIPQGGTLATPVVISPSTEDGSPATGSTTRPIGVPT